MKALGSIDNHSTNAENTNHYLNQISHEIITMSIIDPNYDDQLNEILDKMSIKGYNFNDWVR